jgi:hypothetical protein
MTKQTSFREARSPSLSASDDHFSRCSNGFLLVLLCFCLLFPLHLACSRVFHSRPKYTPRKMVPGVRGEVRQRRLLSILLLLFCVGVGGFSPRSVSGAGIEELLTMDCGGTLRLLSGTPAELHFDLSWVKTFLDVTFGQIKERAKIKCPSITDKEIRRRFMPSVDMMIDRFLDPPASNAALETFTCPGLFAESLIPGESAFFMLIRHISGYGGDGVCQGSDVDLVDVKGMRPSSCTRTTWDAGEGCLAKVVTGPKVARISAELAIDKCSETSIWPYISVTCGGEACSKIFMPCTSSTQCGTGLTCQSIVSLFGSSVDIEQAIADALTSAGIWGPELAASHVPDLVLKPIR